MTVILIGLWNDCQLPDSFESLKKMFYMVIFGIFKDKNRVSKAARRAACPGALFFLLGFDTWSLPRRGQGPLM